VPPPEIQVAPSPAPPITVAPEPPKVEYKIEPPPPPPAPTPAPPTVAQIGVVCPNVNSPEVKPEMPRKALQEGTSGIVRVQLRIANGVVKETTFLSGPRVFQQAIRTSTAKYRCENSAQEIIAIQEFEFKVE
jgi:protein TonB